MTVLWLLRGPRLAIILVLCISPQCSTLELTPRSLFDSIVNIFGLNVEPFNFPFLVQFWNHIGRVAALPSTAALWPSSTAASWPSSLIQQLAVAAPAAARSISLNPSDIICSSSHTSHHNQRTTSQPKHIKPQPSHVTSQSSQATHTCVNRCYA